MDSPRGDASSLDGNKWVATYQSDLRSAAQLLSNCLHTVDDYFAGQALTARTEMVLLDVKNTIDSALLDLNIAYITTIEALAEADAHERAAQRAASECEARRSAAEDAGDDLDAILQIYASPIETSVEPSPTGSISALESSGKLDRYKDFCRVVFGVHDARAKGPTTREAITAIENALQERQMRAQEEDDGLQVDESVVRPVCPITSTLLNEPMRAMCGHYFSESAILSAIRINGGQMKCPSRGCDNHITEKELVRDRMMDLRIMQYTRMEERARQLESSSVRRIA